MNMFFSGQCTNFSVLYEASSDNTFRVMGIGIDDTHNSDCPEENGFTYGNLLYEGASYRYDARENAYVIYNSDGISTMKLIKTDPNSSPDLTGDYLAAVEKLEL